MPQRAPFEENKHKRAPDGKFASKGGQTSRSGVGRNVNVKGGAAAVNKARNKARAEAKKRQTKAESERRKRERQVESERRKVLRALAREAEQVKDLRATLDDAVEEGRRENRPGVLHYVSDVDETLKMLKKLGVNVETERGYPVINWGGMRVAILAAKKRQRRAKRAGVSTDERDEAAQDGAALPDGKLPTRNRGELEKAVKLRGHVKGHTALEIRRYLTRRARALDALDVLPDEWRS